MLRNGGMFKRSIAAVVLVATLACASGRGNAPTAAQNPNDDIFVYVWQKTPEGTHEPIPGVRVFTVTKYGLESVSVLTDALGQARLPASIDGPATRYVFAEVDGYYLTGLPWFKGAREYDLPLHLQMLINRVTVPARKP